MGRLRNNQPEEGFLIPLPSRSIRAIAALDELGSLIPNGVFRRHPRSGRNQIATISDNQTTVFLKRVSDDADAEVRFYTENPAYLTIAPEPLWLDWELNAVALEYLQGAATLADETPELLDRAMEHLGPKLAGLHEWNPPRWRASMPTDLPAADPVPQIEWTDASDACRDVIRHIQRREKLASAYEFLRRAPGPEGFIHGDLKLDNILNRGNEFLLVDWEMCGQGPTLYDLAQLVSSVLDKWIVALRPNAETSPREWIAASEIPISVCAEPARRFLVSYMAALSNLPMPGFADLVLATSGSLTLRSWTNASYSRELAISDRLRLLVAESLLKEPEDFFGDLHW